MLFLSSFGIGLLHLQLSCSLLLLRGPRLLTCSVLLYSSPIGLRAASAWP